MMNSSRLKGFVCGALSAACYGLNPLFALPLYNKGMNTDSVLFYRYSFAIVLLGVLMIVKKQSFSIRRQHLLPLVGMGVLFSLSSLFLFESYNYMDAGIASTILFVYPVLVALIMALFFHERLTLLTVFSISLAVGGIALLYKGGDGATLSLLGVMLVILSSFTYAIYMVWINRSNLKHLPIIKLTFYVLLFGVMVYLIRLHFLTDLQPLTTPLMWGNAVALALFPTILSLLMLTVSIHRIGSTPAAILGALEPVTALCCGICVFGEQLTPRLMLGVVLILIAVSLIIAGRSLLQMARKRLIVFKS